MRLAGSLLVLRAKVSYSHRAGVWSLVQKGDLIWNVAQGDFANEGALRARTPGIPR